MLKTTKGYDEKWLYYMRNSACVAEIVEQDGTHVFDLVTVENSTAHRDLQQNAERLVSCAAKFNQMSTEDIQKMPLSVNGVIAQRDELLKALIDCVAVMSRELNGLKVIQPELRYAQEAIANAGGAQ